MLPAAPLEWYGADVGHQPIPFEVYTMDLDECVPRIVAGAGRPIWMADGDAVLVFGPRGIQHVQRRGLERQWLYRESPVTMRFAKLSPSGKYAAAVVVRPARFGDKRDPSDWLGIWDVGTGELVYQELHQARCGPEGCGPASYPEFDWHPREDRLA